MVGILAELEVIVAALVTARRRIVATTQPDRGPGEGVTSTRLWTQIPC
ncbi:MAG TPA: hypothetical protein VNZ53_53335 [Steroidobacteraceae bacterium]|nr:hypothetical protein [Steroidobacteraceae bacterium]